MEVLLSKEAVSQQVITTLPVRLVVVLGGSLVFFKEAVSQAGNYDPTCPPCCSWW